MQNVLFTRVNYLVHEERNNKIEFLRYAAS